MPSLNHTHSYTRLRGQKTRTAASPTNRYKCADPDCSHIATREQIHGKNSLCVCGRVFQLSWDDLRRARPVCLYCSQTKAAGEFRHRKALVAQAIREAFGPEVEENLDVS